MGKLDVETKENLKEMKDLIGFGFAISEDETQLSIVFDKYWIYAN